MVTLTNKFNLPKAFERYSAKDPYTKGDADFSVTELIDSPQIARLKKLHDHEIEEDVSDRIMSMLGTAVHSILEHEADPGDIVEQRFYADVLGKKVSGGVDCLHPIDNSNKWGIRDYKVTRGMSVVLNPNGSSSWIKQINCYAYLAEVNGYDVEEGEVIAILRDWTAALVRRNSQFPRHPIIRVPITIWPFEERKAFIERCVTEHSHESPRQCNPEERWVGRSTYRVVEYRQDGGLKSRAKKRFNTETEAMAFIMNENLNAEIIQSDGEPVRCAGNYCQVAGFCDQWLNE